MNSLLMMMLLAPNLLGGLGTSLTAGGSSALLPLMLLGGGRSLGTMGMLGLMTGNPMLTIMGMTQRRRGYRRRRGSSSAYWKGYTRGLLNAR